MQIFIHRYDLTRTQKANTMTSNEVQKGALIKLVDQQGHFGVADLSPWPSLGDHTLDEEINQRGELFQNALRLGKLDLEARKNKIKLNNSLSVKNHYLISDYKKDLKDFYGSYIKIKGDRSIMELAHFLNEQAKDFQRIRLDFNGCLDIPLYEKFVSLLEVKTKDKIECVEDPYPENAVVGDLVIASDFIHFWKNKIIKPARHKIEGDFLYLTSAMDHPIGIAHGLIEAQKYSDKIHGFLTLNHYEPTTFHKYFKIHNNEISYESDGYGIGFESELNQLSWTALVDFSPHAGNQLFQLPQGDLEEIKKYFDDKVSPKGFFLVSSSGSSQQASSSLKVYAIKIDNFLNSARRVNQHYGLTAEMPWGCVLPTYHVGGLSILARAHLSQAKVFTSDWKNFNLDWLTDNEIQLLSLVPTQLYDIVQKELKCPATIRHVFIGGAHLSSELSQQALALGWPLVITFGMTETSSMFASRLPFSDFYTTYKDIEIDLTPAGQLKVKCDSLAEYVLQKINHEIIVQKIQISGWYVTEDVVDLKNNQFHFKSRNLEQIKINGEGVSLLQLREKFENNLLSLKLDQKSYALIALPDERAGEQIVLVTNSTDKKTLQVLVNQFNQSVLSHEKIKKTITLQSEIPITAMNKIKYLELKNLVLKEQNE